MPGFGKRTLKFTQGLGYGTLTTGAGLLTLTMATVTMGLAMTGVGLPLAFLTGAGTVGCGALTVVSGKRTGHKFGRAFEEGEHSYRGHCSYARTQLYVRTHSQTSAEPAPAQHTVSIPNQTDTPPAANTTLFKPADAVPTTADAVPTTDAPSAQVFQAPCPGVAQPAM